MELFNKEGHLTDEGLRAVVDGTLDEMGRLEASEHLSFCDSCLVRYTELLADDTQMCIRDRIRDSRALMENAAAIAHSSITGARVHMRRIIW